MICFWNLTSIKFIKAWGLVKRTEKNKSNLSLVKNAVIFERFHPQLVWGFFIMKCLICNFLRFMLNCIQLKKPSSLYEVPILKREVLSQSENIGWVYRISYLDWPVFEEKKDFLIGKRVFFLSKWFLYSFERWCICQFQKTY